MSQTTGLGELEVLLLLAVLHLVEHGEESYGSAIKREVEARTSRSMPRGSIYVTLDRLEAKGLLTSGEGRSTRRRGDRPKRLFTVTTAGLEAVRHSVAVLIRMQRGLEKVLGTS
jgi:PadR family transcriptional regulator, regulatory protein PadR